MKASLILVAVAALLGCGKKEPSPPPPPPAPAPPSPGQSASAPTTDPAPLPIPNEAEIQRLMEHFKTGKPLAATAPAAAQPWPVHLSPPPEPGVLRLYVSVNGSDVPELPLGWPLVVVVSLHPRGSGPLRLKAPSGTWASFVHLEAPEGWPLRPPRPVSEEFTLDGVAPVELTWSMPAEDLDRLPRGTYRIGASLEAPPGAGAWTGTERALGARVTLAPKKPLSEADDVQRTRLLVASRLARGEDPRGEVAAFLKRRPEHSAGMAILAEIQAREGKIAEAVATLDRAIASAVKRNPSPQLYPRDLARTRALLVARLGSDGPQY